jgi:UDP-2,3-diacylglucosamine pyrophosphatase LpxH
MSISFDLISDLHLDSESKFDWTGQATSSICVVAGDIAKDQKVLIKTLEHLSTCYHAVFYIDGNEEHKHSMLNLGNSYRDLAHQLSKIKNVVYLQDNVVVIDGVGILGTNGWWGFDLDPEIDRNESIDWYVDNLSIPVDTEAVNNMSRHDAAYLINSIQRLQTHRDVKKIVVVTHTVPRPDLINHDIELEKSFKFNVMGNKLMPMVVAADTEKKIDTWCFGHYHGDVDRIINNIRYVNNCQGRVNTKWHKSVYYPKRITVEI